MKKRGENLSAHAPSARKERQHRRIVEKARIETAGRHELQQNADKKQRCAENERTGKRRPADGNHNHGSERDHELHKRDDLGIQDEEEIVRQGEDRIFQDTGSDHGKDDAVALKGTDQPRPFVLRDAHHTCYRRSGERSHGGLKVCLINCAGPAIGEGR